MVTPVAETENEERVLARMHSLVQLYGKLPKEYQASYLNKNLLRIAVESYFADSDRTKLFHGIPRSNPYKKAAFTIKWIAKIKPIQLYEDSPVTKHLSIVNSVYAIYTGLSHLEIKDSSISAEFMGEFLYTIQYRPLDEGVLGTMMYLLQRTILHESP